jgi:hypothetical protein
MTAFGDQSTGQVTIRYNFQFYRLFVSLELFYKNIQNSEAAMILELSPPQHLRFP